MTPVRAPLESAGRVEIYLFGRKSEEETKYARFGNNAGPIVVRNSVGVARELEGVKIMT